jgi:TPP-dependent pyruvate/acetoin dehydrogenase alpha subunit
MVPVAAVVSESQSLATPGRALYLQTFRWMLLSRVIEERIAGLYRAGKIQGGVFLGTGQEALSASLGVLLRKGDLFGPLIRDMAGRLAFGETPLDVMRTYLGSPLGPMRARDGNIHRGRPREGQFAMISHLGSMISVVTGGLFARRLRGTLGEAIGATCLGDGASSTGSFHEGMNMAAVERLPVIVVVANNQYAYSTPTLYQFACADLLDRAVGYGVDGHSVDGTDLSACLETMQTAVTRARAGHGPQMVVAQLLRLTGHGEHDDASYMDPKLRASSVGGDCLKLAREQILKLEWAEANELDSWRAQAVTQVDQAVAAAQRDPRPDPSRETWRALSSSHLVEEHHLEG